jgi:hydrogenase small subunit
MPGFPDKFMPFMDEPTGATFSSVINRPYGALIRRLRAFTNASLNREPKWHHNGPELTSGYDPRWRP